MTRTKRSLKFVIKIVNNDDEVNFVEKHFMSENAQMNFATLNNSNQSYSIITTDIATLNNSNQLHSKITTDTARKVFVSFKKVTKRK
jgi:hypothetical protein